MLLLSKICYYINFSSKINQWNTDTFSNELSLIEMVAVFATFRVYWVGNGKVGEVY